MLPRMERLTSLRRRSSGSIAIRCAGWKTGISWYEERLRIQELREFDALFIGTVFSEGPGRNSYGKGLEVRGIKRLEIKPLLDMG
jgi:hypothetical protein